MQTENGTPVISVVKSVSGEQPQTEGVELNPTTVNAPLVNGEEQPKVVQPTTTPEAEKQQKQDAQYISDASSNYTHPPLPDEQIAGRIPASLTKGLLKFLREDAAPKKTFKVGDTAPIESNKPYEDVKLEDASKLVNQSTDNFNTNDLWQTNFNQLENSDDVNGLIASVAETVKSQTMEARKGVRKDEEIVGLANDLGTDPEFVMEFVNSPDSEFVSPEKILAARKVLNQSAGYLHDLAVLVSSGKANPEQQLAFKKQYAFHQQFMSQFMAKRANVGRALRAYGMPTGMGDAQADHIQEMLNTVHGGLDLETAAKQIASAPTAKAVHGVVEAQDNLLKKLGNVFIENFVNSILSGVKTHIVNTTGSALMLGMKSVDSYVAARLGTHMEDVAMKVDRDEWKAGIFGMMNGTHDAFSTMWQVMKTAEQYGGVSKLENNGRAFISAEYLGLRGASGTIVDGIGQIIRTPTERVMGGVDGFMKTIAERQSLAQTAYRIVNAEAEANKWTQEEALARLNELVQNPTPEMLQEAEENSLYVTFQKPLGKWGQKIQKAAGANPFTQFLMPFVKTPANLMKQGFLERTPLAMITKQFQEDVKAGGARSQMAKARMYIGTSFIMAAGGLAATGQITGAGSTNPKVRAAQMDAGWRPYSILTTDENGTKTYVSYQRTEPFSYIFSTVADMYDTMKLRETVGEDDERYQERLAGAVVTAVSHATLERSFMTGLESAMDVLSNPTATKVSGWIKRTVNSTVPFAGTRRDVTRLFDDTKKVTDNIMQEIQANIPYYSKNLPDRLDALGNPIHYDTVLNPLPVVSKKQNAIFDEAARIAQAINKNPIALPQRIVNGVRLTGQQYHDLIKYSRATEIEGQKYSDVMATVINSTEYQTATDDQKYDLLRKITSKFDKAGRTLLFAHDKELFMRVRERENKQAADSLHKKTGRDSRSILERLRQRTSDAYDRAFN